MLNNIAHIIVTYNDYEHLLILLNNIKSQGDDKYYLYIIDNSIENKLRNICEKYQSENAEFIINYIKTKANIGSAGGFALGMFLAYKDYNWVWLHDQDGYPGDKCLDVVKKHILKLNEPCILAPVVSDPNSKEIVNGFSIRINSWQNVKYIYPSASLTKIDAAGSAGLLISTRIIKEIGFYNYIDYFVGLEDYDYCLRAKKSGYNIYLIKSYNYYHPDKWLSKKAPKKFLHDIGYLTKKGDLRFRRSCISSIIFRINNSSFLFLLINIPYSVFRLLLIKTMKAEAITIRKTLNIYLKYLYKKVKLKDKNQNQADIINYIYSQETFG